VCLELHCRWNAVQCGQVPALSLYLLLCLQQRVSVMVHSLNSNFCSSQNSTLLPCRAASRLSKRLAALSINSSTGVTLTSQGKLCISRFQVLAVLSLRDSLRAAPTKVLGDVTAKIPPNGGENSDAPTRARVQRLTSKRVSTNHFSRTRFQRFLSNPPLSSF
jgi:hypothetical protein